MRSDVDVTRDTEHGVELFTLREGDARARVAPAWGANLIAWRDRAEILEPVPLAEIAKKPTSYGIPLLLPFPNRIRDGRFDYGGVRYQVDPPRHGFARSRPWAVAETGASAGDGASITCAFDAADHPEVLAQFPSAFRAQITHRLRDRALALELSVENSGDKAMPFGFGIHPYFRRPARGTLTVPARRRWALADSLPTGETEQVGGAGDLREPRAVSELELDDIYTDLIAGPDGRARCVLADHDAGLGVVVEADAARFPHSVIYTAPAPRAAICIEPYTCPTDAFNLAARGVEAGVVDLAPGAAIDLEIVIRVEDLSTEKRS